jgi:hypothetical protein
MIRQVYLITDSIEKYRNFLTEHGFDLRNFLWINSYSALYGNCDGIFIILDDPTESRIVNQLYEHHLLSNIHYQGGLIYTADGEEFEL